MFPQDNARASPIRTPGVGQNVNERGESLIDSGVVFARLACGFEYGAKLVRRENVWAFDFGTVGH